MRHDPAGVVHALLAAQCEPLPVVYTAQAAWLQLRNHAASHAPVHLLTYVTAEHHQTVVATVTIVRCPFC